MRDLVRQMNLIALRSENSGVGEQFRLEPPAADRLHEIQAPALIIVGDLDQPRTVQGSDLLARSIPEVRKVVMPGTAHLPNMEQPEKFNRIVLDFLAEPS
jgi:pimeloyl-ACP methyl ester carboxylesterase